MAIKKTQKNEVEEFVVEVMRAYDTGKGIAFDMKVNGIMVYGCWYRTYEDKNTGVDKGIISFPAQKSAKDGKYYNHVWFPISNELLEVIEKQIEAML